MPVINGVYLKDFAALPGAVDDANIIPIAISGNQVAYRTTVSGIITDARITGKLLTGLSVTGTAILATDTILQAFGKVQNQLNNRVSSVGLTMPLAFNVANSPITTSGTLAVTAAGSASQYIRGDGQLASFPSAGAGGSSVYYYLNGSVAASVPTYKQMANTAVIGAGTDFNLTGNGLIAQFLTDAGNPNRLQIPGGAWNFEMYFNVSSSGGNSKFYVELLKYDGTTFTSISSSSAIPEEITGGTTIDLYITSLAVPDTTLLLTDRLAIRVYIVDNSGGRTATLHTENGSLCQIITTFAGGISALNGLTTNNQYFAVGTTGTDFNISSLVDTHTFNLPTASATNRGALSSANWTTFNNKQNAITLTTTGTSGVATFISNTLNIPNYADGGVLSLSAIGSTPNANAATITGTVLNLQPADASFGGVITTGTQTIAGLKTFQGTTASDTAPLGSELAAVTGTGTNWTLAGTNLNVGGYTHTVGSVVALTTTLAAVSATYYQITYTITGRTAGSITIAYGGTSTSGITATGATGPLSSSTAVLTITPTTTFDGTVVLSIKTISTSSASSTFANSAGGANIDVRASSITSNTFIGLSAGIRNTTGISNTFIGYFAGNSNTTGNSNTFIGLQAGQNNTTGGNNTFLGLSAGQANTTGGNNTFLGNSAGSVNTTGINNTFLGNSAGSVNTTGNSNTFLGNSAGSVNTTGVSNTFLGTSAGNSNTTGANNTFIGRDSGQNNTTGGSNTFLGISAGRDNTTGGSNTFIGLSAGRFIADGTTALTIANNSIFIGQTTKALANSQTNQIVIGDASTGLGSNTTVLGNASTVFGRWFGNLLIGDSSNSGEALQVTGTAKITGAATFSSSVAVAVSAFSGIDFSVNSTIRVGSLFASAANITFGDSGTPYWVVGRAAGSGIFNISSYSGIALEINDITRAATFSSIVVVGSGASLRLNSNATEGEIIGTFGKGLKFYTNDGSSNPLNLSTTGAATFSSSVTAGSLIKSGGTSSQYLMADGTTRTTTSNAYTLKDWYADVNNVSSTETDLMTYTVPANTLVNNGDKLTFTFSGIFGNVANNKKLTIYFGNSSALLNTTIETTIGWSVTGTIIKDSATNYRYTYTQLNINNYPYTMSGNSGTVTNYTGTNVFKITAEGTSSADITGQMGTLQFIPAG
jgi:hypothetical protein